ncbi:MAG: hypothetical protein LC791_10280, partial [Acidobacteria bacterium]|nr:hypothetical protein [Acidobacteriota bacterium]
MAIVGSAPFLLNTFTVYPEIVAALATIVGFTIASSFDHTSRASRALIVGLAAAVLPWLSTKYAPMSAALVAVAMGRLWLRWPLTVAPAVSPNGLAATGAIVLPYVLSLAAWFSFFYAYWGSPFPQAPYGAMVQTDLENVVFGVPGLLFDQEYGLLAYAPVYILAATGLAAMWRGGHDERRAAIEITLIVTALLMTVGAFRIWWGGSASPGRPLVSGLLLLGTPIAVAFRSAPRASAQRAAQHLLLWLSIGVTLMLVFAQDGMLIVNGRDGSSTLLAYLSPLWEAWTLVPSFIHHEAGTAIVHSLVWLAAAAIAATAMRRVRTRAAGEAALAALGITGAAVIVVVLIMPQLPSDPPQPVLDLRARGRLRALDAFDRVARPHGVIYDPWRTVSSEDLIPMLTLGVEPGARRDVQPVRVLHNGRFSLPAGRYRMDVQWSGRNPLPARGTQEIALQVGRNGPPLETWSVIAEPGQVAHTEFALPVDAGFIGFRGSPELERSIASLALTPLDIVDRGIRLHTPPVLAASRYVSVTLLFHDEHTFPEPSGFWTIPGRQTTLTLARPSSLERPTVLLLHPGPRPNHVVVTTYGWRGEMELVPGLHSSLPLPDATREIFMLSIRTAAGFVPSEL